MKIKHAFLVLFLSCTVCLSSCISTASNRPAEGIETNVTDRETDGASKNIMLSSEISRIYYQYMPARGWSFSVEVKREALNYYLRATFADPENSYEPTDLLWEGEEYNNTVTLFFDRIVELIDHNDVLSWNGFDGYDPEAKDGWRFDLSIDFENGAHLTATGDNEFPPNYSAFEKEMFKIIREIISIYHG